MPLRRMPSARALGATVAIAIATALVGVSAGCSASPPASAPPMSAASELAVFELIPAFESPEVTTLPTIVATEIPTAVPTTTLPPTTVPKTTAGEAEVVPADPRGIEALALIAFPWRQTLPGWSIAFLPAKVGLRGLTKVGERRIEIYVRARDTAASLARVVAHELGHAVDVGLNSPADRVRWREVRGVSGSVSWWPGDAVSDFDTLAGDFAEAFATMLAGSVSQSRIAPPPGPAELAVLAEMVSAR